MTPPTLLVGGPARPLDAPEGHAHPRQQLAHAERLAHVIVGAGVERGHLVGFLSSRREHEDGHLRPLAQPPDHLEPIHVGQAQIQDDQVRLTRLGGLQALLRGDRLDEAITVTPERGPEKASNLRLVLDEDDDRSLGRPRAGGRRRLRGGSRVNHRRACHPPASRRAGA